jgi:hypothetical protein
MHAAHRACTLIEGHTGLNKLRRQSGSGKLLDAKTAGEVPARIATRFYPDQHGSFDRQGLEAHVTASTSRQP